MLTYESRIFPVNLHVAENWRNIHAYTETKATPLASLDSFIAVVAFTHNLIIVIRSESDFTASNTTILRDGIYPPNKFSENIPGPYKIPIAQD